MNPDDLGLAQLADEVLLTNPEVAQIWSRICAEESVRIFERERQQIGGRRVTDPKREYKRIVPYSYDDDYIQDDPLELDCNGEIVIHTVEERLRNRKRKRNNSNSNRDDSSTESSDSNSNPNNRNIRRSKRIKKLKKMKEKRNKNNNRNNNNNNNKNRNRNSNSNNRNNHQTSGRRRKRSEFEEDGNASDKLEPPPAKKQRRTKKNNSNSNNTDNKQRKGSNSHLNRIKYLKRRFGLPNEMHFHNHYQYAVSPSWGCPGNLMVYSAWAYLAG